MRKKIKKIATSGVVGALLLVSSGRVQAQNSPIPARPAQRNELTDSEIWQEGDSVSNIDVGVAAHDDVYGESRQMLMEQGFSPSQIQKLNRRG